MAAAPVLEFERPIAELEEQIEELKKLAGEQSLDVSAEIAPLEAKLSELRVQVYRNLTPLQRVQVARIAARPFTADYLRLAFTGQSKFDALDAVRSVGKNASAASLIDLSPLLAVTAHRGIRGPWHNPSGRQSPARSIRSRSRVG